MGCQALYTQLLIASGLEALGAVSASFRPDEGAECHPLLAVADVVLTDGAVPGPPGRRVVATGGPWLRDALLAAPDDAALRPDLGADAPMVVIRSSGTTGAPKRMALTRGMFEARCASRVGAYGIGPESRYFASMHLSVHTIHVAVALAWRLGGVAMMEDRMALSDALPIYRPTHVTLLPRQTEELMRELPPGFARLPELTLVSLGATLASPLRAAVLERLAGGIVDHYGTNEAGLVCALDADGEGPLAPGLSARIVDDAGEAAGLGRTGRLLVSGAAVAGAYLDEPELSARYFGGGWFASGDRAADMGGGRLRVAGRDGDVLNLGGLKMPCADAEAVAAAQPGVLDAAASQAVLDGAVTVAFVAGAGVDAAEAAVRIAAALPPALAGASVRAVAEVPRTPHGKIRRDALRAMLESGQADASQRAVTL